MAKLLLVLAAWSISAGKLRNELNFPRSVSIHEPSLEDLQQANRSVTFTVGRQRVSLICTTHCTTHCADVSEMLPMLVYVACCDDGDDGDVTPGQRRCSARRGFSDLFQYHKPDLAFDEE